MLSAIAAASFRNTQLEREEKLVERVSEGFLIFEVWVGERGKECSSNILEGNQLPK